MLGKKWGKGRRVRKFLLAQSKGKGWGRWEGVGMVLRRVPGLGLPREVTFPRRAGGGRGAARSTGLWAPAAAAPGTRGRPGPS